MKPWEYRRFSFVERVRMHTLPQDEATGCILFVGRRDSDGYAQIKDRGRAVSLHRWAWESKHGPIPDGSHVLHVCDTPNCINPEHLYLGDHSRNMRDKAERGRSGGVPRGREHKRPMAKLNQNQVAEIKRLLARGYRQRDIARDFSVSVATISDIATRKTWAFLGD